MVRAERLSLLGSSTTRPPRERAATAEVLATSPPTPVSTGASRGDIFARIDARAAFPGVLAACRAWGPDVVISEIT